VVCNTRQKEPLPRAFTMAFGKRNFPVQPGNSYAVYLGFAECLGKGTRQTSKVFLRLLQKHSANVKVLLSVTVTWPSVGHAPTFFLPRAVSALGKVFAECPTENTRQRAVCRQILYRVMFVEGGSLQTLCRVLFGLC